MRRSLLAIAFGIISVLVAPTVAWACGGLVAPNGAVNLVRTATLAAYRNGVEHYVTSFQFEGNLSGKFGSIIPLPGIPSRVRRGGEWTLQRLQLEVQPPVRTAALSADSDGAAAEAQVILEKKIESLDVAVLKGGAEEVGLWAKNNGFFLPPDAPEVLEFYASRSPILMAVRFDADRARRQGLTAGDGIPVHVSIPTPNPWVPLRILGLGKQANERVEADVFLLTEGAPTMLPVPVKGASRGLILDRQELASESLLADLRSDRGMKWLPRSGMWLSYLKIDTTAGKLKHDLAVDSLGIADPSPVAAGLVLPDLNLDPPESSTGWWAWLLAALSGATGLVFFDRFAIKG
ncbi:MAG TPA: DUF2330 domain-containing protein [Actinomycetota bacterium]|nr:DUF2330 domain-containing protein [Actinomycetota bacterium]